MGEVPPEPGWCRAILNAAIWGELVAALCLCTGHLGSSCLWRQQHLFYEHELNLSCELNTVRKEGPNQNLSEEPIASLLGFKRK